jgi:hypothetical protein
VRAEHRDGLGGQIRGGRRQLQRTDMLEQSAHRGAGGARHVIVGDVEQRGDGGEVALGGAAVGAAAFGAGQPARLQTAAFPGRPQAKAGVGIVAVRAGGEDFGGDLPALELTDEATTVALDHDPCGAPWELLKVEDY